MDPPPPMVRQKSDRGLRSLTELGVGRAPPRGLVSEVTAGTTHVAAQGSLIGTNDPLVAPPILVDIFGQSSRDLAEPLPRHSGYFRRGIENELPSRPSTSSLLGDLREANAMVLPSRSSVTSLRESGLLQPTQPSKTDAVTVPLGRSKSQLTLLLERERERTGERPRSKS